MMNLNRGFIWLLAIVITIAAAIYQRKTGPTNPRYVHVSANNISYRIKLLRTHITTKDAIVDLPISDTSVKATLYYRVFPKNDSFSQKEFKPFQSKLLATLPSMPSAGKLEYYIVLESGKEIIPIEKDNPIVTRFRNDVPAFILIPHILFMFFAMLISTYTGLLILFRKENYKNYMYLTLIILFIGGLILGPLVQKHAFGEYWTGFPFGFDLTDNKTLIAFVFWIIAFLLNRKTKRTVWIVIASVMMMVIFSIPHSMWGSQLDNKTGKIITGKH